MEQPQPADYVLGHAPEELERLIDQARFFGDLTEHVLQRAGLAPGMRVLDIGCGVGDVTFLAAKMVGPRGIVIGIDKSPEAIAVARQRAQQAGLESVRFIAADVSDLTLDEPVDALIGRLILMYFPAPALMLRRLLALVRPGGLVAFHEMDMEAAESVPVVDEYYRAGERVKQAFSRAGIDIRTGLRLRRIFQEAGLPAPQMLQMTCLESGPHSRAYAFMEQITRTLLPVMERTGVATSEEVAIETLAGRIREEVVAKDAVLVLPALIGAWARRA